jgi:hypothetical protein
MCNASLFFLFLLQQKTTILHQITVSLLIRFLFEIVMKPLKFLLFFTVLSLVLTSCFDDEGYSLDKFWVDIATVDNAEGDEAFFLELDDSTLLWTAASAIPYYKPKDGQRVIANYTILADKTKTGMYDYDVKLNDVYEVLTKGIFQITPQKQDSIGNDSVQINDIWVGSKYLNVEFVYQGYNAIHYINLVSDASKSYADGKVHLEFRHNNRDDFAMYNYWGLVSFDISSLQDNLKDSVQLVIHANLPDRIEEKQYEITYHYKNPAAGIIRQKVQNPFEQKIHNAIIKPRGENNLR